MFFHTNRYLFLLCIFMTQVHSFPLKILFILDKFPWYTKTCIVNQITGLLDLGHDVRIYARTKQKSDHYDPVIYDYNLLSRVYYKDLPKNIAEYDVFFCQYGDDGKEFVPIKRALGLKGKLVTFIRGGDITNVHKVENNAYGDLFKYGDLFLPVCEYFKSRLISLGCDPHKVQVLHSAINCNDFPFKIKQVKDKKINLISVGRLNEEKGHPYVLKALATLIHSFPQFRLQYFILGDGSQKKRLQDLVQKLKINKNVTFLGWRSQKEVIKYLDKSHIGILASCTPSRGSQEGIPNALKESMACGLPVIGTYHSGIRELIEYGITGFLVPERDSKALTQALKYLITHQQEWETMGKSGRKKIEEEFDTRVVNQKLINILESLQITG